MGCVVGLRCWGLLGNDVTLYRVLGSLKKKKGLFSEYRKDGKEIIEKQKGGYRFIAEISPKR